jgi:hypothetical protein
MNNFTADHEISNTEFLQTIFGDHWARAIVTGFTEDPSDADNYSIWSGGWAEEIELSPEQNNFFTVSLFEPDNGSARRRKELFKSTHVIVIDDVGTKIDLAQIKAVHGVPNPSYQLETSPGNEQWGYLLDAPCASQAAVDALQDAIVRRLCDGKDPGQKGVTRYARLPVGSNTKLKYVDFITGGYPRHRLLSWHPEWRYSIDGLLRFFNVNPEEIHNDRLESSRSTGFVDTNVKGHPILSKLDIKRRIRTGIYDVTCPWAGEHTDGVDNGTAVMSRTDGSVGFECHHGHCNHRSGNDLVKWLQFHRGLTDAEAAIQFAGQRRGVDLEQGFAHADAAWSREPLIERPPNVTVGPWNGSAVVSDTQLRDRLVAEVQRMVPGENYRGVLRAAVTLDPGYQDDVIEAVGSQMAMKKATLQKLLAGYVRDHRRVSGRGETEIGRVLEQYVYLASKNVFLHRQSGVMLPMVGFQAKYSHLGEALGEAVKSRGEVEKVHEVTFDPGEEKIFEKAGASYYNLWDGLAAEGVDGDAGPWLSHLARMVPDEKQRRHLVQWMAHTLQHPGEKINHAVVWGSRPGCGKDTILWPLMQALGEHARNVQADALSGDFNEYLTKSKLVVFQEAQLEGDNGAHIERKLRTLLVTPPDELRVNLKGVSAFEVRNCVSAVITTNAEHAPLAVLGGDRRYFMLWTDIRVMGNDGNMLPEWAQWYRDLWGWMKQGRGWLAVVGWLMRVDLTGFDPKASPPMTQYREETIQVTKGELANMLEDMIQSGTIMRNQWYEVREIYEIVASDGTNLGRYGMKAPPSETWVGRAISKVTGAQRKRTKSARMVIFN